MMFNCYWLAERLLDWCQDIRPPALEVIETQSPSQTLVKKPQPQERKRENSNRRAKRKGNRPVREWKTALPSAAVEADTAPITWDGLVQHKLRKHLSLLHPSRPKNSLQVNVSIPPPLTKQPRHLSAIPADGFCSTSTLSSWCHCSKMASAGVGEFLLFTGAEHVSEMVTGGGLPSLRSPPTSSMLSLGSGSVSPKHLPVLKKIISKTPETPKVPSPAFPPSPVNSSGTCLRLSPNKAFLVSKRSQSPLLRWLWEN